MDEWPHPEESGPIHEDELPFSGDGEEDSPVHYPGRNKGEVRDLDYSNLLYSDDLFYNGCYPETIQERPDKFSENSEWFYSDYLFSLHPSLWYGEERSLEHEPEEWISGIWGVNSISCW